MKSDHQQCTVKLEHFLKEDIPQDPLMEVHDVMLNKACGKIHEVICHLLTFIATVKSTYTIAHQTTFYT